MARSDASRLQVGVNNVRPTVWQDTKIVFVAPGDFGTGLSDLLVQQLLVCGLTRAAALEHPAIGKLNLGFRPCADAWKTLVQRLNLAVSPGFVTKTVPVVVRTSAGQSSTTFTYRVTVTTQ